MCGGPLKCGGPCSAEHVRTLVNPALLAIRSRDRDRDLDKMNSSALESRDHGLENTTLDKVRRRYRHRQAHSTFEHFNLNF